MRDFDPPERFRDVFREWIRTEIVLIVPVGVLLYLAVYWRNAFLIAAAVLVTGIVGAGLWRQQRRRNR